LDSQELAIISLLRDDQIREMFARHISPDMIVEDIARSTFLALCEANTSDLSVIRVKLRERLRDDDIFSDVLKILKTVRFDTINGIEKAVIILEGYVRWRKVSTTVQVMGSQDLDCVFPTERSKDNYDLLRDACNFKITYKDDEDTFRLNLAEDYARAKQTSEFKGRSLSSCFRLINMSYQNEGYTPGTVSMIVAPPGVGKSTALVSEGANFSTEQGTGVLHYVLGDLNAMDVCQKYIARLLRKSITSIKGRLDHYWALPEVQDMFSRIVLRVKSTFEVDVDDIYRDAMRWRDKFDYGVILLDYDGNIKPSSSDGMYSEGGYSYGRLAALAREVAAALLVGCQPKPAYWREEKLPLESPNESSKKQHHVDNITTLSNPDKGIPLGLLHLPKVRRGESGWSKYVCYLNGYGSIQEIEKEDYKKIRDWYKGGVEDPQAEFKKWAQAKFRFDQDER
jgi:hypothetical protein